MAEGGPAVNETKAAGPLLVVEWESDQCSVEGTMNDEQMRAQIARIQGENERLRQAQAQVLAEKRLAQAAASLGRFAEELASERLRPAELELEQQRTADPQTADPFERFAEGRTFEEIEEQEAADDRDAERTADLRTADPHCPVCGRSPQNCECDR